MTAALNITQQLRDLADRVIGPVDGAYGRPWMSRDAAAKTRTVLVGANAATPFPAGAVARDAYLEALLAGGPALASIYAAARPDGAPSPTRVNINRLVDAFEEAGLGPVLETNAVPIATKRLAGLGGMDRGWRAATDRFLSELLGALDPNVVIVHGAEAAKTASRQLGYAVTAPSASTFSHPAIQALTGRCLIATIPSLSPPTANLWLPARPRWAEEIADAVRQAAGPR